MANDELQSIDEFVHIRLHLVGTDQCPVNLLLENVIRCEFERFFQCFLTLGEILVSRYVTPISYASLGVEYALF